MKQWCHESRVGPIYLAASATGLRYLVWRKLDIPELRRLDEKSEEAPILERAVRQIDDYLAGDRESFDLPIELNGTPFQMRVWEILRTIPFGETLSYSEVARKVENVKAVRAVGSANGRNPISLVVPCHRVINSGGRLGGYAGGIEIKKRLLEIERRLN